MVNDEWYHKWAFGEAGIQEVMQSISVLFSGPARFAPKARTIVKQNETQMKI